MVDQDSCHKRRAARLALGQLSQVHADLGLGLASRNPGRPVSTTGRYSEISWPESSLPRTRPRVRAMPRETPWMGVE